MGEAVAEHPSGPRRGRPPRLSREAIVRAAARFPADDLTMPKLAAQLGVSTPALYHYFPNRRALVEALGASVLDRLDLPSTEDLDWRGWLRAVADALRDLWTDNPPLLDHDEAGVRSAAARLLADTIEVMSRSGFRTDEAMRANELIIMVGYLGSASRRRWQQWGALTHQQALAALADSGTELSHLPDVVDFLATFDLDEQYHAQVETVLDGIAAHAGAAAAG